MGTGLKVAILSDIHGNADALRAALTDAERSGAERLFVLGDLVGYYYGVEDVLKQLRAWPATIIRGNHEALLVSVLADRDAASSYRRKYGSSLDRAIQSLPASDMAALMSLPESAEFEVDELNFELFHGSPLDPDEYVYPDADRTRLTQITRAGSVVLLGHTHYPMIVSSSAGTIINPGSIGQARDSAGFASWCLFDVERRIAQFKRTPYDVRPLLRQIKEFDPDLPYLANVLTRRNPMLSLDRQVN